MRLPVQQSLSSDRYKVTPLESGNYFAPSLGVELESCQDDYTAKHKRLKKLLTVCGIVLAAVLLILCGVSIYFDYGASMMPAIFR